MSRADGAHDVERRLGLGVLRHDLAVGRHVHHIVREDGVRVPGVVALVVLLETEDHARLHVAAKLVGDGGHGMEARRRVLQRAGMLLRVALELHAEVVEGEVRDRDAARDVLEVEHLTLELLELLAAVLEVVHLAVALRLQHVLLAGGRRVEQRHAPLHAALELDVLVERDVRPEVDQLNLRVLRTQAVDTAEALDDAHGVPMDVVVHQAVAVLQVLALGDAVRREDDVDLAERPLALRQLLGDGREPRKDVLEGGPGELKRVGPVGAARHLGALDAELPLQPGRQLLEEVRRRVGERAEHQHLAVAGVVRLADLARDEVAKLHELGVALGRHRVGIG